jgi:hypothetical protein
MSEPTLILQNMRGSCATEGETVHALFRFNGRKRRQAATASTETISAKDVADAIEAMASSAKV